MLFEAAIHSISGYGSGVNGSLPGPGVKSQHLCFLLMYPWANLLYLNLDSLLCERG